MSLTSMPTIPVPLNRQQLELVDRTIALGLAADRPGLLQLALREYASPPPVPAPSQAAPPAKSRSTVPRKVVSEFVLEPGTGKAVEVFAGQVLRIEQVEGGQCVD